MINHMTAAVHAKTLAHYSLDSIVADRVLEEWYLELVEWVECSEFHETREEMVKRDWPAFTY